ncbi:MAG: right-handed parallel beta-helix repeat-containing protein [Planctomycetaceae bacterium]
MLVRSASYSRSISAKFIAANLAIAAIFAVTSAPALADTIYVNNRVGDDQADGRTSERTDPHTGPVATIRRALEIATTSGTISIAKTDKPYDEAIELYGRRHSGMEHLRFTIEGNGAIFDGSLAVAPDGWRKVGNNLWKLTPRRKGYFQLLLNGQVLPEHVVTAQATSRPEIPEGKWSVYRGSIYFHSKPREYVPLMPFRIAYRDVGLTLYRVRNVTIRNLTFQHFRIDGISAPDHCSGVTLENVSSLENGRAGVAVGGSSDVVISNCRVEGNRKESVLVSTRGNAAVEESTLNVPPTIGK